MAQDKLDKHFKDKLEIRAIQPTSEAWDTLATMLDKNQEPAIKTSYYKISIAASVVFLLGLFLFNNVDSLISDEVIVNSEIPNHSSFENTVNLPFSTAINNDSLRLKKPSLKENTFADIKPVTSSLKQTLSLTEEKEIIVLKEKVTTYLNQLAEENQVQEYDLDAEIDALLAKASNDLNTKPVEKSSQLFKLDNETNQLLAAALEELNLNPNKDIINESLKKKLFKELEKGYFKSKVFLAERGQLTKP
ncbi:hypothetical protein OAX11_01080 [Flavobacteriaceae bacterium]|jgi:hypothetical protein|nr:hypothetical protein [Flavobacteriaceae bacterium]